MKLRRAFTEAMILTEVRDLLVELEKDNDDCLTLLALNSIKNKACAKMMNGKISDKFYVEIFTNKDANVYKHWAILNKDKIMNYVVK